MFIGAVNTIKGYILFKNDGEEDIYKSDKNKLLEFHELHTAMTNGL
jgi:hypothetical protein